jgi:hypothetical protein
MALTFAIFLMSHPELRTNPDASHICAKIKFHTYDDSLYKKQCHIFITLSAFRDRGVPKPTSECRRVPQLRWVDARPSTKGGSEVAGDRRERGGNPAAFVFVPRPGRVRLQ